MFDLSRWSKLAQLGSLNAITGLSEMVNQEVTISTVELEEVSIRNAVNLVGKPDDIRSSNATLHSKNRLSVLVCNSLSRIRNKRSVCSNVHLFPCFGVHNWGAIKRRSSSDPCDLSSLFVNLINVC